MLHCFVRMAKCLPIAQAADAEGENYVRISPAEGGLYVFAVQIDPGATVY
jgi:hypothetical protein